MEPPRQPNGTPSLKRTRHPEDEDTFDPVSKSVRPLRTPVREAAEPLNEEILQDAIRKPTRQTRRRRQLTQEALALRAQGQSVYEIATALRVKSSTITQWFAAHRRELAEGTIDRMLDDTAVPLAAENLIHGLIAGDKDYTLETLKGRGILKRHSEGDGIKPAALPELRIAFITPARDELRAAHPTVGGSVHGTVAVPKALPAAPITPDQPSPSSSASSAPLDVEAEIVGKVE